MLPVLFTEMESYDVLFLYLLLLVNILYVEFDHLVAYSCGPFIHFVVW